MKKNIGLKRHQIAQIGLAFVCVFVLIFAYLGKFSHEINNLEEDRASETLANLAIQGAVIAEDRIRSATALLWSISGRLDDETDWYNDMVMDDLRQIVSNKNTDLIRIGIADRQGNASITDGRKMDVSENTFFKEAIQGKEYVSSVVKYTGEEGNLAVAVPIKDSEDAIQGVLYGIISTKNFQLYENPLWNIEEDEQYMHIIDDQGNYIAYSKNENSIIYESNIYTGIDAMKSSVSTEKIKEAVQKKEVIITKIKRADEERYVYFAPMNINNWCVVTILTGEEVERQTQYSQREVFLLIIKILGTIFIFGIFCYRIIIKEVKKTERLNEELSIKDKMFRIAISGIGNFVFTYNPKTKSLEFMNHDPEKLKLPHIIENFPETFQKYITLEYQSLREIEHLLAAVEQGEREIEGEIVVRQEGIKDIYRVQLTSIVDDKDETLLILGSLVDITEEKQAELRIMKGEQIRAAMLSDTLGFYEIDLSKDRIMRNGELDSSSYSYTERLAKFAETVVRERDRKKMLQMFSVENMLHLYETGVYDISMEYVRILENNEELWVESDAHLEKDILTGDIIAIVVVRNINDKKAKETELRDQAFQDSLTKAYNRGVGAEKINKILRHTQGKNHALLVIDLDNFKNINDTLGHLVGDQVLVDVVTIIKQHVYADDIVCRLGGDEFAVFIVDIPEDVVSRNVLKLLEKLNLTYEKDGMTNTISASVGIALAPEHGSDFQTLYENADSALYEVKKNQKNGFKFYKEE